jgi:translation initiation factor IF-2
MAKKRVHEIAKERGITSKEALAVLQRAGLGVTAPASSVEEAEAARAFGNGAGAEAAPPAAGDGSDAAPKTDGQPAATPQARPAAARPQQAGDPTAPSAGGQQAAGAGGQQASSAGRQQAPGAGRQQAPSAGRQQPPGAGGQQRPPARGQQAPRPGGQAPGAGRGQAPGAAGRQQAPGRGQQRPGDRQRPAAGDRPQRQIPRPPEPPAGEPIRRAGPAGRGPRILQDAPPPQERGQQGGPRGGQRPGDRPGGRGPGGPRGDRGPRQGGPRQGGPRPGGPGGDRGPRQSGPRGGDRGPVPGGPGAETGPVPGGDRRDRPRPTRGARGGESGAGAGRRRRVVIDSQASRRERTPPPQQSQPPRRGRGRRRRPQWVEPDLEAEALAKEQPQEEPTIQVRSGSTVKEVAESLQLGAPEVIKKLMELGEMATLTQTLSDEAIEVLADALDKKIEIVSAAEEVEPEPVYEDAAEDLVERPPVITVMGHVDHGKTSLLDAIRQTQVAAGEAGGITQHIGAYQVRHDGHVITFLDTPGHEAFTAMRARGAKVTDIAVIVVAADDGVMPQTVEAIDHAKAAGVPVMVAVNKIDKEGADPNRVRGELAQQGLTPADWGGDTEFVDVSAKTRQNLDDLLETLVTLAEIQELKANPQAEASGFVIESRLDPGRGPVVTLLIQRGRLQVGDALVAGEHWGRVRAMSDFRGQRVRDATPGMPVEILGFDGVPDAGEHFHVVENEREARRVANERAVRMKQEALARQAGRRVSLEDVLARAERGEKELNLVIKADVAGSLEALADQIARLPQQQVTVNIIRDGVGGISESDVMLASASDAVVIGFNVRPVGNAGQVAESEGVEIRTYSVIYRIVEDLRAAMEGMLEPEQIEETIGTAEVRATFRASRVGTIAGSYVREGTVRRGGSCRLVRDGTVIYDGRIASLRRFKDDVREVTAGLECGIVLENYPDVKEGDVIEVYETRQVEQTLS